MKYVDTRIPGWNGAAILNILATHAAEVPDNGVILELGALFGRSTCAIGHNKKESVILTSIDIWPLINLDDHKTVNFHDDRCGNDEKLVILNSIIPNPDRVDSYELWKHWTKEIPNLNGIQGYTDMNTSFFPDFDLIVHDASHEYDQVYKDLVRWFPKLKSNGAMIIDDYEHQFPGVVKAVDQYVMENDLKTEMVTGRNILIRR